MKKDILFIIPGLGAGGGEKSLITLLNEIDYSKYNVDLFLLNHKGLFMNLIPSDVNIVGMPYDLQVFNKRMFLSIGQFISEKKYYLAYCRLMFFIINRVTKNRAKGEQYTWKYLRNAVGIISKEYDVSIGYLEKTSNYLCIDCSKSKKKIGWIHNDYNKLNMDASYDLNYLKKMDYIVTVSNQCQKVLETIFPSQKNKVRLIHNMISVKTIDQLAKEQIEEGTYKKGFINILSIGRLDYQKGFDIAIQACKLLVEKGYKINWCVIGEGKERKRLEQLINQKGVKNHFHLWGLKSNPYKYIHGCDLYVQPSRFEGKSIAIDEVKILCRPIVVTDFSTVKDQIEHGKTGLITSMNSKGISNKIEELVHDRVLYQQLIDNLQQEKTQSVQEIDRFYKLINE